MKRLLQISFCLALTTGLSTKTFSQLVVDNTVAATQLINDLVGTGVGVSGVTINCANGAYARYSSGSTTNIGFDKGVLLTTSADANSAKGPNNTSSFGTSTTGSASTPFDFDLRTITLGTQYDLCAVEFDFVPFCNKISLNYVFASEEYPEFVCSQFNDVFGFFITGPNPSGAAYSGFNIATVPGTSTPVAINTINPGRPGTRGGDCTKPGETLNDSIYYVNNNFQFNPPTTIQYDGFTVPMTATADVVPCQTYHFKLAIADISDGIYDSGVFFEAAGFNCNLSVDVAPSNQICFGDSVKLTATGITGNNFTWTPAIGLNTNVGSTVTASPPVTTIYQVTGTNPGGCQLSTSVTVNVNGKQISASAANPVMCVGAGTTLSASGSLNYTWSPGGQTGSSILVNPGSATTYTVIGTDAFGCKSTTTASVSIAPPLNINTTGSSNPTCSTSNGSVNVNVTSGTPSYTYSWSGGVSVVTNAGANTLTGLTAGDYTITVTDGSGCASTSIVASLSTTPAVAAAASPTAATCSFNNGSITATPSGGNGSFSFSWNNGPNTQTNPGLGVGSYTVTITDGVGCTATSSASINNIAGPVAGIASLSPVSCNGNSNGAITASTSGGTAGFTFNWGPGGQTTQTITGLGAGIYTVTITDANNCISTATAQITQPTALTSSISQSTNVSCKSGANGSASIAPVGGTPNYTYTWLPTGGATDVAAGLGAGSYSVTVTDANSCTTSAQVSITEPTLLVPTTSSVASTCGKSDGIVTVSATGGSPVYTYSWNTAAGQTASGLPAGSYTATVTDAKGCSQVVIETVNNAGAASVTISGSTNATCYGGNNGSANATASGGSGALTYSWSNAASGVTSISGLTAGSYTLSVTDANGCLASSNVKITEPQLIVPSVIAKTNASCNSTNGAVSISIAGGTGTYSVTWSSGAVGLTASNLAPGNYIVTVKDANLCSVTASVPVGSISIPVVTLAGASTICIGQSATLAATVTGGSPVYSYSWSNTSVGGGTQIVSPIVSTTYTLTITDATSCTATQTVAVAVNPALNVALSANVSKVCLGSSITLTANASGGNGIYSYSWLPGGSGSSFTITPTSSTTYTVQLTDACGTPTASAAIPLTVNLPPAVAIASDVTSGCGAPLCVKFTGTTSASCVNSNWNFGDNDSSATTSPVHCYNNTGSFSVSLKCTDANGCSTTRVMSNMISVLVRPVADFSYTPSVLTKKDTLLVKFVNKSTGSSTWLWNFGDTTTLANTSILQNPTHTYKDTGKFCIKLIAYASNGCVDTTIKCLSVEENCSIPKDIPNVFSPNGDGMNDLFLIKNTGLEELICTVYNRWGMLIYEYNAVRSGWDGRTFSDSSVPVGTYYYILKATCKSGEKLEGKGFLQLLK